MNEPEDANRYIACQHCDALYYWQTIPSGCKAKCSCCGKVLWQNRKNSFEKAAAYALAALTLMAPIMFFPIITMDAAGMSRKLTPISTASSLFLDEYGVLSVAVVAGIVIVPMLTVLGALYICGPLARGHVSFGARFTAKMLKKIEPWNTAEVFLLGVIVSLIKLDNVADVHFGLGFWAFCGLTVCLAGISSVLDPKTLWDRIYLYDVKQ